MKLKFDSHQAHQQIAIQAAVKLFDGQPLSNSVSNLSIIDQKNEAKTLGSLLVSTQGVGNNLAISEEQLLINLQSIQKENDIAISEKLAACSYKPNESSKDTISYYNHFSFEMETGTGKTYSYLRTIYELNKLYGFLKFVIVVPNVAIREGVIKSLEITHAHLQDIYGKPLINFSIYDREKLSNLRNFAASNFIQILIINIDSFNKSENVINTEREQGIKPIEFIQATNPIVILDEPQNMETDRAKEAIHSLNPLCTLRYSATHREKYNLLYSLNPVMAYNLHLVKEIEVDSVSFGKDYNETYIRLNKIITEKNNIKAELIIHVEGIGGVREQKIKVGLGVDLYDTSNRKESYKDGYTVVKINGLDNNNESYVEFSSGRKIYLYQAETKTDESVIKFQIERAIEHHFRKEIAYWINGYNTGERIKVLTIFFLDRVSNYREYDSDGNAKIGKYAQWFEELYKKHRDLKYREYETLLSKAPEKDFLDTKKTYSTELSKEFLDKYLKAENVHNGYFSQDKHKKMKDTSENRKTEADNDIYKLIMKDKERLLSFDEPLRFIFSHSALREGWDNPNVFQICTLNESRSEIRKRQEIGRGLRLCVNEKGERVMDKKVNLLTVITNESYDGFVKQLQNEIQEENNIEFKGIIKNVRDKVAIKLNKQLTRENCPLFFEIWDKINYQTRYKVEYDTKLLIENVTRELLSNYNQYPKVTAAKMKSTVNKLRMSMETGVSGVWINEHEIEKEKVAYTLPDAYAYIQNKVKITRSTICNILKGVKVRHNEFLQNPRAFLDTVSGAIKNELNKLFVSGIVYEKIAGKSYEMTLFETDELGTSLQTVAIENIEKTLYDRIPVQSNVENEFVLQCQADESVQFFFKLPNGFKIPTPIGNYTPDWAVIFQGNKRIYFVAETKSTSVERKLRGDENIKIKIGEKHFELAKSEEVKFVAVNSLNGLKANSI